MTALMKYIGGWFVSFPAPKQAPAPRAVLRTRATGEPVDFAALRQEAMRRFPKTRAYLAR